MKACMDGMLVPVECNIWRRVEKPRGTQELSALEFTDWTTRTHSELLRVGLLRRGHAALNDDRKTPILETELGA